MKDTQLDQDINRIANKYPWNDSEELFKAELRDLVQSYANQKVRETYDESTAYCSCGDALERTGLYPNESTYYCSGCNETYILTTQDPKENH